MPNSKTAAPFNTDYSQYKMYVGDTGLFITLAFWDKDITENIIYQKLLSDKLSANLGYVYENIVAQVLTYNIPQRGQVTNEARAESELAQAMPCKEELDRRSSKKGSQQPHRH